MIRNWLIDIRVMTEDGACEALDVYQLPEDTGVAVTDDEREELGALLGQMKSALHRIVNRRVALHAHEKTAP